MTRSESQGSPVPEEPPLIRSNDSDVSGSRSSRSPQPPAAERRPIKKRGRSRVSESEGEADAVQPKRPRVRGRVEGEQENRLSLQRVKFIDDLIASYLHLFFYRRIGSHRHH